MLLHRGSIEYQREPTGGLEPHLEGLARVVVHTAGGDQENGGAMKSLALVLALALGVCHSSAPAQAEQYEASWGSLDRRPTPQWWSDARFGVFVFWGPAAVPAYSPRGQYAEWYWHWIETTDAPGPECREFHDRVYGEDFEYADRQQAVPIL